METAKGDDFPLKNLLHLRMFKFHVRARSFKNTDQRFIINVWETPRTPKDMGLMGPQATQKLPKHDQVYF